MPGSYAKGAKVLEAVGDMLKSAKEQIGVGAEAFGVDLDGLDQYPPLGAEEETYQQEEK
jgi:hypothetical protein